MRRQDTLARLEALKIHIDGRSWKYEEFERCVAWLQSLPAMEGARVLLVTSALLAEETGSSSEEVTAWLLDKQPITIGPLEEAWFHFLMAYYKASQTKSLRAGATGAAP